MNYQTVEGHDTSIAAENELSKYYIPIKDIVKKVSRLRVPEQHR